MTARFVYRPDHPFGPNVIDRKTGRFMSPEDVREMAAALPAQQAEPTQDHVQLARRIIVRLGRGVDPSSEPGADRMVDIVAGMLAEATQPTSSPTITVQEAWLAAGGNPGIQATKEELLEALRQLDAVCDEADQPTSSPQPVHPVDQLQPFSRWYLDKCGYAPDHRDDGVRLAFELWCKLAAQPTASSDPVGPCGYEECAAGHVPGCAQYQGYTQPTTSPQPMQQR